MNDIDRPSRLKFSFHLQLHTYPEFVSPLFICSSKLLIMFLSKGEDRMSSRWENPCRVGEGGTLAEAEKKLGPEKFYLYSPLANDTKYTRCKFKFTLQDEKQSHVVVSNTKFGFISRSTFKKFYKRFMIFPTDPRRVRPRSKIETFLLPPQNEFTSTRFRHQMLHCTTFDGFEYIQNSQMKGVSPFIVRRIFEFETGPDAS